ncbi:MAG: PKD domain-containing protein [Bacillota bacterium]
MKLKLRRTVPAIMAVILILMVAAVSAYAYVAETYPDYPGIRMGDQLRMKKAHSSTPPDDSPYYHAGKLTVMSGGRNLGQGMIIDYLPIGTPPDLGKGYTTVASSAIRGWIAELNGNLGFVQSKYDDYAFLLDWRSYSDRRMYIGDLAELCGGRLSGYDHNTKTGYATVTNVPDSYLGGPRQAGPGKTINLVVSGKSNVLSGKFPGLSYELKANGAVIDTDSTAQNSFNKTIPYRVNSPTGSSISLELAVKDGVWRVSKKTLKFSVVQGEVPPDPPEPPPPSDPPPPPPPPPPPDMEPEADFTASNMNPEENESVSLEDSSSHPGEDNGERIVSWAWDIQGIGAKAGKRVSVSWPVAGAYKITLTVTDSDGDTDTKAKTIAVAATPPVANITVSPERILAGRQVAISGDGSAAGGGRTISQSLNEWQIYRPGGTLKWSGTGRYPPDPGPPGQMFDAPGVWKVRLRVTDSSGNKSDWAEEVVQVLPDQPPLADFWVPAGAVRSSVGGYSITVQDRSQVPMPDSLGDRIYQRTWSLVYDKNNNGSFGDAGDEIIAAGDTNRSARILQASGNDPSPHLQFFQTGRYKLKLSVREEYYGWDSWNPGLQADTASKPGAECVITVQNLPPYVSIGIIRPEPKADVLFVLGQIDNKRDYLNSFSAGLPGLAGRLAGYGIDAVTYQNDAMGTGSATRTEDSSNYIYLIGDPAAPLYKVYVTKYGGGFTVYRRDSSGSYVTALNTVSYGGNDIDLHASGHGYSYGATVDSSGQIVTRFRCGHDDSYRTIWVDASGVVHIRYYVANDEGYNSTQRWDAFGGKVELVRTNTDGRSPHRTLTQIDADTVQITGTHSGTWELTYTLNYPPTTGKLREVAQSTGWRAGSVRFLVLMNGAPFDDYYSRSGFVDYMRSSGTGLIAEAGAANSSQCIQIVSEIGRDAVYSLSADAGADLGEVADYIINYFGAGREDVPPNVVLVNERFNTSYSEGDRESDPLVDRYWEYTHDPNSISGYTLSNSLGLNTDVSGRIFPQPLGSFSKPGTYTVSFKVQDQPPNSPYWGHPEAGRKYSRNGTMQIHVHRRPVASFSVVNPGPGVGEAITYINNSYDPDLQYTDPEGKRGIRNTQWRYSVNGGTWITSGEPPAYGADSGTVEVMLRVQDFLGAWSDWASASVNVQNRKPVARFSIGPPRVGKGEIASLADQSYDLDGDRITAWNWTVQGKGTFTTQNVGSLSWGNPGSYTVTLAVMDEHGLWSDPAVKTVAVEDRAPNNPPVVVLTGPSPGYRGEPMVIDGRSSSDPDPGDFIARAYWRYARPGNPWSGTYTQQARESGFLTFPVTPDRLGDWQFELVVEDSRQKTSAPGYLTVHVEEPFEVYASVIPSPAERGRRIRVTASAVRPSNGQKIQIDRMMVEIPHPVRPDGRAATQDPPHTADMVWDPGISGYTYEYLVPEKTNDGYWSDDGDYYVRVTGYKGESSKQCLANLTVKGHVMDRTVIRTYGW